MTLTIRPYQAEGIEFLTSHHRALLADRPGLGKSMQALLSMDDRVPSGRVLIVATGDAIGVWQDEIETWLGQPASIFAGPGAKESTLEFGSGYAVTNYSRLSTALTYDWDGVIFDESQTLRNRKTRTLYAAIRSVFTAQRSYLSRVPVYFLSGTPIVKAAGDLWPILHLIDSRRWSSYWAFVKKYAITWEDQFGWHVEGVTNVKGLWAELEDVCLRRLEGEVPLPPSIRQRIPLTMNSRQARAYRELEADMYTEVDFQLDNSSSGYILTPSILARETRLRQLLACPRILGINDNGAALDSIVEIAHRSPDPFVIFSPFEEALPYAADELSKGRSVYSVHGGMGNKFNDLIEAFKTEIKGGASPGPVLTCTVQMGKSWSVAGLVNRCYMLGADWNATTQQQAESRLNRDGQIGTVFAEYFAHEDTIDYHQLDVLAGKKRLSDVIMDRITRRRTG